MNPINQFVQIVLVETSHPGNIGSVARAMKNMGLANLALINPKKFPHQEATSLAGNATDVLENAKIFPSRGISLREWNCRSDNTKMKLLT